jgi:hypothetical protein
MNKIKVKGTLIEQMLGTKPADNELFDNFLKPKCPSPQTAEEEAAMLENKREAGTSTFFYQDGKPLIKNYQIKGFFKAACQAMRQADDSKSKELKAYRSKIDCLIFVEPKLIFLNLPEGTGVTMCQRPLRADTPQGPRVTLKSSESVPAGTWFEFEVTTLRADLIPLIMEWLAYGEFSSLGEWRNSGCGRTKYEIVP